MAALVRLFDWKNALVVVKPDTLVRWHRKGFRLFWRWKSRHKGRPPVPEELKKLIVEMARANVSWGEKGIAHELLVKLGVRVSPRTVGKYMPSRDDSDRGASHSSQCWSTFVRNHAKASIASCPKTQTNSRLARRAVSIVIDLWRAPLLGRVVLALFAVGNVYVSLCKKTAYAPFSARRRSRALFWL